MPSSQNIYTVDVIGTDPSNQAAWDSLLTDIYSRYYDAAPGDIPAPPQESEPAPLLPEVVVNPPKLTPAPTPRPMTPLPPANDPIFELLPGVAFSPATIAAGIVGLLFPQPTGPARYDEAPSPTPELDEVQVVSTRLPYGLSDLTPVPRTFVDGLPRNVPDFGFGFPDGAVGPDRGPLADPFADPVTSPWGLPNNFPEIDPANRVRPTPQPNPRSRPDLDPFAAPSPRERARPLPRDEPVPDVIDSPFDIPVPRLGDPFKPPTTRLPRERIADPLNPFLTDFNNPVPQPQPEPEPDPCARGRGKKDKKEKKRTARTVCWKGTYVQRSKGISYTRKEQVPCEAAPAKGIRNAARKIGKKLKPGQFPSTALSGGQIGELATDAVAQFAPILYDWWKDRQPKKTTKKRNRKAKTKPGRVPGTIFTTPFYTGD